MLYTASFRGPIVKYDLLTERQYTVTLHVAVGIRDMAIYDKLLLYIDYNVGLGAIETTDGQPIAIDTHGLKCDSYYNVHVMDGMFVCLFV